MHWLNTSFLDTHRCYTLHYSFIPCCGIVHIAALGCTDGTEVTVLLNNPSLIVCSSKSRDCPTSFQITQINNNNLEDMFAKGCHLYCVLLKG